MKRNKKILISTLVALLMLVLGATTIMAASSEKKLSAGKWVNGTSYDKTIYYKVTVKNDGVLTISAKNLGVAGESWMDLYIYKKDKGQYYSLSNAVWTKDKSKTVKYAVEKGTYYIKANTYTKFKYTFTKMEDKANYCASKAITLKKAKEVAVVNSAMNGYDRWYKIKLTKKQMLTIWNSGSVAIYDSNFNVIDLIQNDEDYTKYYSTKMLGKGTYYVRIYSNSYYNSYNRASYTTFKWK